MASKQEIETELEQLPHVISTNIPELLVLFRDSITSNLNGHTFTFNGIYESVSSQAYHNNMYYYDRVKDKDTQKHITLFLHKKFKKQLKNREPYEFTGKLQLHREIRSGSIAILLYVSNVNVSKEEKQFITESEYSLIKTRYDRGLFNIENDISQKLYNEIKPKILVFTGKTARIEGDYSKALLNSSYYELDTVTTNFSNKNQFFKSLENIAKKYDYFAIVRGGGSGLGFFDQEDVCKKVLDTNIPFITAIGHDADKTMLEKAADKAYATPTAFGNALEQLVQKDINFKRHIIALEKEMDKRDVSSKQSSLKKEEEHATQLLMIQNSKNKHIKKLTYVIIGLVIVILLLYFLR